MRVLRGLLFQIVLWSILPLVVITALSVVSIYGHEQATRDLAADRAARLTRLTAARLSDKLADHIRVFQTLADAEAMHANDPLAQQRALDEAEDAGALFNHGIVLVDAAGWLLARSGKVNRWPSQPPLAALQSQVATSGQPAFSPLYSGQVSGEDLILLAVPVPNMPGGVLVGAFPAAHLGLEEMLAELQIGRQGIGEVIDSRGRIIYAPQADMIGQNVSQLAEIKRLRRGQDGALFYNEADGQEWVASYAPVPVAGWGLIVRGPWRELGSPIAQFSLLPHTLVILAALVSLLAMYLIVHHVIQPLRALDRLAGHVAWGDFSAAERPVSGVQEIRDLYATLQHMAGQIQRYQAGMQSYIAAVTQGQEAERSRLARELHDDTAQALVGLIQRIKLVRRDFGRDPARAAERLNELESLATTAWQEVRRFSEDLRPSYLEQLGLVPAMTTLIEQMQSRGETELSFTVSGPERRLSSEQELATFRILQQALINVHQHAQARHAALELSFNEEGLSAVIQDDGLGFEPPELPYDLTRQGHYGLAGMHERAVLVGGHLSVDSAPGQGTRVTAFVPYQRQS
jgi:signal transduction histidine kinase